ncbi:hypothetical protein D9M71_770170 [compost metagenome]
MVSIVSPQVRQSVFLEGALNGLVIDQHARLGGLLDVDAVLGQVLVGQVVPSQGASRR